MITYFSHAGNKIVRLITAIKLCLGIPVYTIRFVNGKPWNCDGVYILRIKNK
jgi:hypothetical protein